MSVKENPICCNGNCNQGRACPARIHGMAPTVDERKQCDGVVAGDEIKSLHDSISQLFDLAIVAAFALVCFAVLAMAGGAA